MFCAVHQAALNTTTFTFPGTGSGRRPPGGSHRGGRASGVNGFHSRTAIPCRSALRYPCLRYQEAFIQKGRATPQAAIPSAPRSRASASAAASRARPIPFPWKSPRPCRWPWTQMQGMK